MPRLLSSEPPAATSRVSTHLVLPSLDRLSLLLRHVNPDLLSHPLPVSPVKSPGRRVILGHWPGTSKPVFSPPLGLLGRELSFNLNAASHPFHALEGYPPWLGIISFLDGSALALTPSFPS